MFIVYEDMTDFRAVHLIQKSDLEKISLILFSDLIGLIRTVKKHSAMIYKFDIKNVYCRNGVFILGGFENFVHFPTQSELIAK